MPSEFPGRSSLLKGALAVYDDDTPGSPATTIVFQYNPAELSRELALRASPREASNVGNAKEDVLSVLGPPLETINLTVELDAADQLEEPGQNALVVENGLHPALASLEMLLYPPSTRVNENAQLAAGGAAQLSEAKVPLVLLVLGRSRVAPVFLTKFSVTEEAFDNKLNPIRAKVALSLRVLTYMELQNTSLGYDAYVAFQRNKENLAEMHRDRSPPPEKRVSDLIP